MSPDDALFALPAGAVAVPVDPPGGDPVSAGRRLAAHQRDLLAKGVHPLMGSSLHPEAAPADDRAAPGRRCGTCRHRTGNERHYPKCMIGPVTHGAATDCRAWWPGCNRHEPHEEAPTRNGPDIVALRRAAQQRRSLVCDDCLLEAPDQYTAFPTICPHRLPEWSPDDA